MLATVACACSVYFFMVVVSLHFLRRDYDPIGRYVSEYAVGPYSPLMASAFFALALGSLILSFALSRGGAGLGKNKVGLIPMGIWGVCFLVVGVFPTDLKGASPTPSGTIHTVAAMLGFVSLLVAMAMLSVGFRKNEAWNSLFRGAVGLTIVAATVFILFLSSMNTGFVGLSQRVFIFTIILWLVLTATRLRSINRAPRENKTLK